MQNDVRRGLGMLPQRAIFAKAPKGDFVKMSEPVQVYTACQFVKGQNIALNYFQLGNNSAMPPVANSSTSQNSLFAFLDLCPTWLQVKLRVLTIRLDPKSRTSERSYTTPLAKFSRSQKQQLAILTSAQVEQKLIFIPDELAGIFTSRQIVGKLCCHFRSTWSEVIWGNTTWQAGQRGATLLILRIFL